MIAAIILGLLLWASPTWATTYYVSTTGLDANSGTSEATPFRTINKAVLTMVAGDTTYVRGGTYSTEPKITISRSGTAAAPIKLLNYPGESPIIDFQDRSTARRLEIYGGGGGTIPIGYITVEGFEIKNSWDGIKYYSLHHSTIRRNWIHDNNNQGILGIGGHHNLIERNIINHNGDYARCASTPWFCNQVHGIYAHGPYTTIVYNLIYDAQAFGIQQNGSSTAAFDPAKHPSAEFAGADHWVIAHNTIAYGGWRGAIVVWGGLCSYARIENNIFYENSVNVPTAPQGIEWVAAGGANTGITVKNNHMYATGSPGSTIGIGSGGSNEGVNWTQSGNVVNVSSPAFVNGGSNSLPASPDFSLTSTSPAISMALANEFPNNGTLAVGAFQTVGSPTATITTNKLAVTFPMNLNTPVQLSSTAGWSITCTANPTACPGSPTISSVVLKPGTSSVLEATISGITADTCATGQDWKISYNATTGNVKDSANIGTASTAKAQKIFSFTNLLATNACSGAPPTPPAGPHIWYKFNGDAQDSSGNALHGTAVGTSFVDGKINQAIKIDVGENDYVAIPYGNGINPTTQSLTIIGGIWIDPSQMGLNKLYFGAGSLGVNQRFYLSTIDTTWMLGIQGSSDGVGASEFSVQAGWNRVCIRLDKDTPGSGTGTATLAVNGVTGSGSGVVKSYTSYTFSDDFKIGSLLGGLSGAGQLNDDWKIYTLLVDCAEDYAAWNNQSPPLTGTLSVTASRWYGAKTQGGVRIALADNNSTTRLGRTSAFAYVAQTECSVTNCSPLSQRLYYSCPACPSLGAVLPVPDYPTADGVSFYGVTQEPGMLSGDHGGALTGSPTLLTGGTQFLSDAIPSFTLATGEAIVNTYVIQFTNAPLNAVFSIYPQEQSGLPLSSITPTGGLTVTIVSNSSSGGF